MQLLIDSASAMEALGCRLGQHCPGAMTIYLQGALGAGKTTLVRGILRGQGYEGKVKSPTYTLVEPYEFDDLAVFHFDLYRLIDPVELSYIGYRDYFDGSALVLVEWPEKAGSLLPAADLCIDIQTDEDSRCLQLQAMSPSAKELINKIQ